MRRRVVSFHDSDHKPNLLFGAEAADDGNRPVADVDIGVYIGYDVFKKESRKHGA